MTTEFESVTCARCCGTGKHSWCQQYRDKCFKCNGNGVMLTKRGLAAFNYMKQEVRKPITELNVGDLIENGTMVITEIEDSGNLYYVTSEGTGALKCKSRMGFAHDDTVLIGMVHHTKEEALEYQNKLTKTGNLMKKYC